MLVALSLRKWLWRAQLKSAVIPFLFVELGFLSIYFFGAEMVFHHNADAISKVSQEYMKNLNQRETRSLGASLEGVESHTNTLSKMVLVALNSPAPALETKEVDRYQSGTDGSFYTDRPGGSAAFYSGIVPVGKKEKEKVWKTTQLDGVMKAIKASHPLIQQLYFNSFDSYNRIYPYFDVKNQYPSKMNIPSYNFYYEADLQHNPERTAQWTNAYFDPAGSGWMVSSISPVWRGDFLEGVVGIDITLSSLLKGLSDIHLPWEGYVMLLDTNGSVLAIPNNRRKEWGLNNNHTDQNSASMSHNWKALSPSLKRTDFGVWDPAPSKNTKSGQIIVWNKVPNTNWFLLTVLDKDSVFAKANALHSKLNQVGWALSIFLLIFYLIFFYILYRRSKKISQEASDPIVQTQHMVEAISIGNYPTKGPASNIFEIQQLSDHIIQMGRQVELANRLEKQNRQMTEELYLKEKELAQKQQAYIEHLAHEIRTPLMQISCITTHLNRALEGTDQDIVRNRLQQIALASKRVSTLFNQQYAIPDVNLIHTKIGDILEQQLTPPHQVSIWVDEHSKNIPLPITGDILSSTLKTFMFLLKIDRKNTPVFIQAWNNEEGAGMCLQNQPFESFQAKLFLAQLNQDPPSGNMLDDLKLLHEVIRQTGGQIRLYHIAAKGKGLLVMWPAVAQHKAHILSY